VPGTIKTHKKEKKNQGGLPAHGKIDEKGTRALGLSGSGNSTNLAGNSYRETQRKEATLLKVCANNPERESAA